MTNEEVLKLKEEYDALDKEVQRLSARRVVYGNSCETIASTKRQITAILYSEAIMIEFYRILR